MTDIRHIDDVLPHVEDRPDFRVHRGTGYVSVDYTHIEEGAFDHPVRRECRGIKFHEEGHLIARPLHKFFNVGERGTECDLTRPHTVTEKLDGSMIHPAQVRGRLRLMTRAGITDVSQACEERWLDHLVQRLSGPMLRYTPIFEWTSPRNRIVLSYPEDQLWLLAVRENFTGRYLGPDELGIASQALELPTPRVLASDAYGDWEGLARHVEGLDHEEGFVVWFDDGEAVKIKAPWYVTRHRALDGMRFEHHVLRLVLEGGTDDVLPLLAKPDMDALERFDAGVREAIRRTARFLLDVVEGKDYESRKELAMEVKRRVPEELRGAAFRIADGDAALDAVEAYLAKSYGDQGRAARALTAVGAPRWKA